MLKHAWGKVQGFGLPLEAVGRQQYHQGMYMI